MRAGQLALGLAAVGIGAIAVVYGRRGRGQLGASHDDTYNAMMREYAIKKQFETLLRDDDPDSFAIAEDFALQHGLKLSEVSEHGRDGRHPLDRQGMDSTGSYTLSPLNPADAPLQRVDWYTEKIKGERRTRSDIGTLPKFNIGYRVWWNNTEVVEEKKFEEVTGPVSARKQAAALAWVIAKRIKQLPPSADPERVKDEVYVASRNNSWLKIPHELRGRRRRR